MLHGWCPPCYLNRVRIFSKLFVLLAALSAVPILVTASVVLESSTKLQRHLLSESHRTGEQTSTASAEALREQAEHAHLQIVRDKAAELRAFFAAIRRAVALEARLAEQYLASDPPPGAPPIYSMEEVLRMLEDHDGDFVRRAYAREPYVMFHLAPGVDRAAVGRSLERLRPLGVLFAQCRRELPGVVTAYVGHREGMIVGYPGETRIKPDYDPRERSWYKRAAERGRVVWTDPYVDRNRRDRVITCAAPFYDSSGALLGVAGSDLKLTELLAELVKLPGLETTEAILVDDASRVLVSEADRAPSAVTRAAAIPTLAEFRGGRFAPVLEKIREKIAQGTETLGILYLPLRPGAEASLCAFATVEIEPAEAGREARRWTYVVETPNERILLPAVEIKLAVRRTSEELSGTIQAGLESIWRRVFALAAAVVVLALGLAYAAARATTRPLIEMAEVAHRIGEGDLDQRVHVASKDEIGRTGQAINEMIEGLRERELVKSTFKRYVSPQIVDDLLKAPDQVKLGGEKRELTVFFSDLADFASVSETLTPEALVGAINGYLGVMTDAIFQHGGTVDKYIGDGIMAFWGAPNPQPDHALRACRAAIDNLAALRRVSADWEKRGLPRLEMRIGINTGDMVVGNMGSAAQMNYTVMGDAVNLGSRLEGANKVYGTRILVSETTRDAAGAAIEVREIDLIAVKGKRRAVRVYELVGLAGEVPAERVSGCRAFEAGLAAYRERRWDAAEAEFRRAIERLGDDEPSRVFLRRIAELRAGPVPEAWDGTYALAMK
jgi:class 3 adenylate cyclase